MIIESHEGQPDRSPMLEEPKEHRKKMYKEMQFLEEEKSSSLQIIIYFISGFLV